MDANTNNTMRIKDGFKGEQSIVLPKAIIKLMENDPLASSIYITDIGYYPKALHHYRSRKEPISQYVFIYCVDGKGWFEINGKHYNVEKTSISFFLPACLIPTQRMKTILGLFTGFIFAGRWQNIMRPTVLLHWM